MRVLAESGRPVPPADRATLRRVRHVVADLGTDLYVAEMDAQLAGLVHVTYARQLAAPACARLELLLVRPVVRRRGVGTALLALAMRRAERRGCARMECACPDVGAADFFARQGWRATGGAVAVVFPSASNVADGPTL